MKIYDQNLKSLAGCTLKKGLAVFTSPAEMSLTKLFLAGNNLPSPSPRKVWSKQIQESGTFFYNVCASTLQAHVQRFLVFTLHIFGPISAHWACTHKHLSMISMYAQFTRAHMLSIHIHVLLSRARSVQCKNCVHILSVRMQYCTVL